MVFNARVLLVDEDDAARAALWDVSRDRYTGETVSGVAAAIERLRVPTIDVVIAEIHMTDGGGLALLQWIKREQPALPVILVSASGGVDEAVEAMKLGAFHYLAKPCDGTDLCAAVDRAVGEGRAGRPEPAKHGAAGQPLELIGTGPAMRRLQQCIDLTAASSAPVLITGESGAGKELVARAIHSRSARHTHPFIAVNTAAIPADLLEAEILGHARGGFTGATQVRKGLVTEASGGTLLLDEVGDMPLALQAKLLRVLQFGEVRPVGSDRVHLVDVRVIAATHRDLPTLVRERRFREDLYFRLNVLPILVPPLRDRREDIPALAAHLLAEARRRSPGSPVRAIEPSALEVLAAARWPGNVRELASVIERLVVFERDERIEAHHVAFLADRASEPAPTLPLTSVPAESLCTLRRLTQAYTEQVLAKTGGDKQRAAEILGVDLSTLYRWERARQSPRAHSVTRDTPPPSSS
jgi:two-component system, NtrC family, response regulator HydG